MESTRVMKIINNGLRNSSITQTELAKSLNVEKSTVNRWCTGKAVPEAETFLSICEILNTSLDGYLGLNINKDQRLNNQFNLLDDETKKTVIKIVSEIAKLNTSIRKK